MPHKTLSEPISPGISTSASSFFDSDSLKVRRTSNSVSGLSPKSRPPNSKSITIQDLVGGEKKATNIHPGTSKTSLLSAKSAPTVVPAENKIQNIIEARKSRQRRRSSIQESLENSNMLLVSNSPTLTKSSSFDDVPDDQENVTIPLKDAEEVPDAAEKDARRRRRRSSVGSTKQGISPSRRMGDTSRDLRLRMLKSPGDDPKERARRRTSLTNAAAFSPKSPNMRRSISGNSLKDRLRQRLQGINYCDLDASDTSDTEVEGSTCKRSNHRSPPKVDLSLWGDAPKTWDGTGVSNVSGAVPKSWDGTGGDESPQGFARKQRRSSMGTRGILPFAGFDFGENQPTGQGSTSKRSTGALTNGDTSDECLVGESDTGIENQAKPRTRSKSKQRARSKSRNRPSKKQTEAEDGTETSKKTRSKSKNRVRSKSKNSRRPRKEDTETTEDETSINSNSNSGRRGGRRPSLLAGDPAIASDDNAETSESRESRASKNTSSTIQSPQGRRRSLSIRNPDVKKLVLDDSNSSTEKELVSQGLKKKKKSIKTKKKTQNSGEGEPSLGFLLDSERSLKRSTDRDDLSHVTEEQSCASSQGPQQILLQFDPTKQNHVRSVDQDKAKKSSETIHGLNGTKSTLEISELAGLPTFERPNNNLTPCPSILLEHGGASMPCVQLPGQDSIEDGAHNAQWDYGGSNSARQSRSIASVGKNMFFSKKGKVDGEKHHKAMRRSSLTDIGGLIGLGGRNKFHEFDCSFASFGDDESLLKH